MTLFAGLPRGQNLRAVGDTVVTHISAKKFRTLFETEPDTNRALLTISLRRIHCMMEFMDGQRRWPLPVRIAHLLLTSVEDRDNTTQQHVECKQEDLAVMLGVSRVSIGSALKKLQSKGMVLMQYGSIELTNVPNLIGWLKDNYQVTQVQPLPGWHFGR